MAPCTGFYIVGQNLASPVRAIFDIFFGGAKEAAFNPDQVTKRALAILEALPGYARWLALQEPAFQEAFRPASHDSSIAWRPGRRLPFRADEASL
jgi:hypothetical protein